jgi:hypothetical protein
MKHLSYFESIDSALNYSGEIGVPHVAFCADGEGKIVFSGFPEGEVEFKFENGELKLVEKAPDPTEGFVDLGLSVKWSATNLGATAPQAFGSYYAWGETKVKDNYKLSNSIAAGLEVDCIKGNKEYDAARLEWGGTWRMPTIEEIMELRRECSWVRCVYKGVYGVKITGPSGGRIFLPAAGYRLEESLRGAGDVAYYWTSTPEKDEGNGRAKMLHFDGNRHKIGKCNRLAGLVIRPVAE